MNTLHLVDPETRDIVAGFPAFNPSTRSVEDFRTFTLEMYAAMAPETRLPALKRMLRLEKSE